MSLGLKFDALALKRAQDAKLGYRCLMGAAIQVKIQFVLNIGSLLPVAEMAGLAVIVLNRKPRQLTRCAFEYNARL